MEIAMTLVLVVAAALALVLVPVLDVLAERRRARTGAPAEAAPPRHRTTHLTH